MVARRQKSATRRHRPEPRSIGIARVEDLDALWRRQAEWNALVGRSETNTIFQTVEWHASWWNTFSDDVRPLLLLAEVGGEMAGIAPLMLSEQRLLGRKQRVVEFIGTGASDYCDFIVDQTQCGLLALMLQWLVENDQLWDLLHLSNIPNTSDTLRVLPEFFKQYGYLTDVRVLYEAPTRIFGNSVDDQRLVRKKSLRRHYNYFRRNGQLDFKNCVTAEEIASYLDLFFQQHIQRWSLTDTPSQFLDQRQRTFYREAVQALAPTGWLLFSVLLFDQAPIAFHFGFEYGNRIIWYKPTFDVHYFKHSPGEVLIKYLLEYALEREVAEFDFTIGEEAFKYRFANHARLNYGVRVFRHSMPYHVNRFLLNGRALIKRSPTFARLGHRLLRSWRGLRE